MIRTVELTTLTAAGTSTANDVIAGFLLGAYVLHNTAGTMTLSASDGNVTTTFLTLDTGGTQWYYPRSAVHNSGGTAMSYANTYPIEAVIPFVGPLRVVTNAAGTAAVTAIVKT